MAGVIKFFFKDFTYGNLPAETKPQRQGKRSWRLKIAATKVNRRKITWDMRDMWDCGMCGIVGCAGYAGLWNDLQKLIFEYFINENKLGNTNQNTAEQGSMMI